MISGTVIELSGGISALLCLSMLKSASIGPSGKTENRIIFFSFFRKVQKMFICCLWAQMTKKLKVYYSTAKNLNKRERNMHFFPFCLSTVDNHALTELVHAYTHCKFINTSFRKKKRNIKGLSTSKSKLFLKLPFCVFFHSFFFHYSLFLILDFFFEV